MSSFPNERWPADWAPVLALIREIIGDCEALAQHFGLKLDRKEALNFALKKIISSVEETAALAAEAPQSKKKSGPHRATQQFLQDWESVYSREKARWTATPATIDKWIRELQADLRRGKTKAGGVINRAAIRKYIEDLRRSRNSPPKKIKSIRTSVAETFLRCGSYGHPKGNQDAESFVREKLKRGRRSVRQAKKNGGAIKPLIKI